MANVASSFTLQGVGTVFEGLRQPAEARRAFLRDLRGKQSGDPGPERALREALDWLGRAQDNSASNDGGVARHYSLRDGWGKSYPETTGYIVPTVLDHAQRLNDDTLRLRARRMLDWLVSIQFPEGGFQGGVVGAEPCVPVTFNTGQILIGLAAGERDLGGYRAAMRLAADWLVETQDADGCWRRFPTPFAAPGEKAYETHVAWGLFEAAYLEPERPYGAAGLRNVDWALSWQRGNGWFDRCCLSDAANPLTHTIGYVLRGVLEAYRYSGEDRYLAAAGRTAEGCLTALHDDGFLPGQLRADWSAGANWVCLTGSVQIAHCWLLLHGHTGDARFREAADRALGYVRRTIDVDGPPEIRGAVKGSFPVFGDYGRYEYLNWAAKFFIDCQTLALDMHSPRDAPALAGEPGPP